MIKSKFLNLVVLAGLALVLALWVASKRNGKDGAGADAGQYAIPGLHDQIDSVQGLRLVGAGDKPRVTLVRGPNGWTVSEKGGYPADLRKLRDLLIALADARLLEPKTALPESYKALAVEDVSAADAQGTRVEIDGLPKPVRLIVGKTDTGSGENSFVRRADEAQSWLAQGSFPLDPNPSDWLRRDLINLEYGRVREAIISHGDQHLRAFKDSTADSNYRVSEVPRGRTLTSESAPNGIPAALSNLQVEDVLPAESAVPPAAGRTDGRYLTFDGLLLNTQAWSANGKFYARFAASFDEAVYAESSDPDAPDHEARLTKRRAEVASIQARTQGWTFVVPESVYSSLNVPLESLLVSKDAKP